jgi:cobalt/nickel transport system permease protein
LAHIPDGVLSVPVLVGGGVIAAAGVGLSLRHLDDKAIPRTAILAAVFFVASLFAVPVGPSSVHLLLGGLMGLIIGTLTFPAVLIGLILQAVLFGFGGLTTLGVNTVNMALPGVVLAAIFAPAISRGSIERAAVLAGICAGLAVIATGFLVALCLALSSSDYVPSARILVATYVPLMVGEGVTTGFAIAFIRRAKPELLTGNVEV